MDRYQGQGVNSDQPPPYSSVVGNPQYGFVAPGSDAFAGSHNDPHPKSYTAPGIYPHPIGPAPSTAQGILPPPPQTSGMSVPVGIILPPAVGTEPTSVTCYNCNKIVTTRVVYSTAWHTHLAAGSICVITMFCSLCCLGLIPYCFDTFKDAEHYCPNCNTFIGKSNKC